MKHTIKRNSPYTGKWHQTVIDVEEQNIVDYLNGALIQEAFPTLNSEQREFVKTGYTPDDWTTLFGGDPSPNAKDYVECEEPVLNRTSTTTGRS